MRRTKDNVGEERLGIIILNYNTFDETIACVNSIRKYTTVSYRIYIVDNFSPDGSGAKLFNEYEFANDVKVILNNANTGYSAGNNVGIQVAEKEGSDYIAIVNSDVELLNDAFRIMIEQLKNNSDCMMIGPSVLDINGNESQLPRKMLTYRLFLLGRHPFCDLPIVRKKGERNYTLNVEGVTKFIGSVSGCCFIISVQDFARIDYFDENEFLYYEEDTLAYKMDRIGKKAAVDLRAKVIHKESVSTNKEGRAFVQFYRWTSVLYMLKAYAKISKNKQIFIALWNIITWDALSLKSDKYKSMKKEFREKNWEIVRRM